MEIFKTVKETVNIDIFRKSVFINSQYCNWYNVGNNTILAGIMRNIGYFYKDKLSAEDIQSAGKIYRKYTTIMNCVVGVEILLYIYLVIFPFFLQFMKQQFIISVLALSIIPLLALYLSYIVVNKLYENEIFKTIFDHLSDHFYGGRSQVSLAPANPGKYLWHGSPVPCFDDENRQIGIGA